jgi:hypothetical protein
MSREALPDVDEESFRFQVAIRVSIWHRIQDIARAERRTPREQAAILLERAAEQHAVERVGHAA